MLRTALLLGVAAAVAADGPNPKRQLKKYTIDLDAPPEERWVQPAKDHKEYIKAMVTLLKVIFETTPSAKSATHEILDAVRPSDENRREMQGVADALNMSYEDALLGNLFYEVSGVTHILKSVSERSCTSIIAQNANGTILHGRNQDYPPPFSPLMFDGVFVKGGKTVYEGTTFAGTVGIGGTCVVPGGFSVSIDARGANHPSLDEATKLAKSGAWAFPLLAREACERGFKVFDDAVSFIANQSMILPGYFIMGGTKPGEGAVVTHNSSNTGSDVWRLKDGYPKGSPWFLVETNYDHTGPAPSSDDRRDPAIKAMTAVGAANIDFDTMWDVLSTKPVYNGATIHTDLVNIATGEYRTYLRHNII
eukprot:TRINITY_DN219_c0_g1_i3.p2 TRINITY_DN219_c0_g1~~TRINITY_DN219_c0_g1_i3.p2  ORF type:complete len:364 (+),score=142.61 TRINITY_DN219_c0_g1_i3:73-1164(+)